MSDDLNKRNTESVRQALASIQTLLHAQTARIDTLNATIAGMTERIAILEKSINTIRAMTTGRGPTVT